MLGSARSGAVSKFDDNYVPPNLILSIVTSRRPLSLLLQREMPQSLSSQDHKIAQAVHERLKPDEWNRTHDSPYATNKKVQEQVQGEIKEMELFKNVSLVFL